MIGATVKTTLTYRQLNSNFKRYETLYVFCTSTFKSRYTPSILQESNLERISSVVRYFEFLIASWKLQYFQHFTTSKMVVFAGF